ncbi:MAG TPA: EGF domain-containing protein [Polyangiales bacterium]|nr:EGF domain-containing protein [Polyangiales bacterium]
MAIAVLAAACGKPQEDGPRGTEAREAAGGQTEFGLSCADLDCPAPATCVERVENNQGTAECQCPRGFKWDGAKCADVDECARAEDNDCGENAECVNRDDGYTCRCKPGYGLDNGTCQLLDLCVGVANTCHPSASCALKDGGGIDCSCAEGFEGNGFACVDVDECAAGSAMCADNAHCVNTRENYDCACDPMYTGDGRVQCRERCEAAQMDKARCDPSGHGQCVIGTDGEASCTSCSSAYLGDGKTCNPDAGCAALRCGANTICGGSDGARECACAPGYEGDPTEGCSDMDECTSGGASCDPATSRCLNTAGGFVCECKPGFERDGTSCRDVDECKSELNRCDVNAKCVNKVGGYSCECNPGFELQPDGLSCADIDECSKGTATCRKDDAFVKCVNTRGGYECKCPSGFTGDGKDAACYCDFTGWWGVRQDATLVFPERAAAGQVLVSQSVTYASIWELHKLRYDGEKIVVEKKACGSDVLPEIYSPLYMETYSSGTPNMVFDRLGFQKSPDYTLKKSDALPMKSFTTPRVATLSGIQLDDPLNDPWPKPGEVKPEQWVDTEDDGEPGISLWPMSTTVPTRSGKPGETYSYLPVALQEGTTIIDRRLGCASVALRTIGSMRINIDSCEVMSGTMVDTHAEGRVHSCSVLRKDDWEKTEVSCNREDWAKARRCAADEVKFLDDQDQTNMLSAAFVMQKLSGLDVEQDCAAVRAKLPAIERPK